MPTISGRTAIIAHLESGVRLKDILEDDFRRIVEDLAVQAGWTKFHDRDARLDEAGFPDNVFIHQAPPTWLAVEFKRVKGRLQEEQKIWKTVGEAVMQTKGLTGFQYRLWTPLDWEEIKTFLRRGQ
jgi:hypothetical protein